MPWEHCGREVTDDAVCPGCGLTKAAWTVSWEATRQFTLRRRPALRLALVDGQGRALAGERFHVRLEDGTTHEGVTDELGTARVTAPSGSACKVAFPDRPGRAVVRARATPRPGDGARPARSGAEADVSALPTSSTPESPATSSDPAAPGDAPVFGDAVEAGPDGTHEVEVGGGRHTFVARLDAALHPDAVWLLGDDDAATPTADVEQVVNLPARAPFLGPGDDQVHDRARFGRALRVKVRVRERSARGTLRVCLRPATGNLAPLDTAPDDERYAFTPREEREVQVEVGADGTAVLAADLVRVTAIAADAFRVVVTAADGSTPVQSPVVTVVQRLSYLTLPMRGVPAASSTFGFRAHLRRAGIDLVPVGAREVERIGCIHGDEYSGLLDAARAAYDASGHLDHEPHLIAVAFVDQAATPAETSFEVDATVGPGQPSVPIEVVNAAGARAMLWSGLDSPPDPGWFLGASFDAGVFSAEEAVPHALVRCEARYPDVPRQMDRILVDVAGGPFATGAARSGTLTVRARIADTVLGGLSILQGNLVLTVTSCGFVTKPPEGQLSILAHEAGHKLGMVADHVGHPTRYEDHGHFGRHCHHRLPLVDDFAAAGLLGRCIMFGSADLEGHHVPFCDDCVRAFRRLDLSVPFTRFPTAAEYDG